MPVTSATTWSISRRSMVQPHLGKKVDPIAKIAKAKRAGGIAQMVECLSSTKLRIPTQCHKKTKKREKVFNAYCKGPISLKYKEILQVNKKGQ
jgi:hypothetical protein